MGLAPHGAARRNLLTLQNSGKTGCKVKSAQPMRRNFHRRMRGMDDDEEDGDKGGKKELKAGDICRGLRPDDEDYHVAVMVKEETNDMALHGKLHIVWLDTAEKVSVNPKD